MSTPSTPSKPGSTVSSESPNPTLELTPRSKIRALLNDFESDDDSPRKTNNPPLNVPRDEPALSSGLEKKGPVNNEEDESESESVSAKRVGPRVARMLGQHAVRNAATPPKDHGDAYSRVKMQILKDTANDASTEATQKDSASASHSSSEDDFPVQKSRKRQTFGITPNVEPAMATSPQLRVSRQASPSLFVSSRSQSPASASDRSQAAEDSSAASETPNSRAGFKGKRGLLRKRARRQGIEKAVDENNSKPSNSRAEKLAREVADLEDIITSENDDVDLTQQSRPARKAGKKALDEMSRETQRMARNQYLAHNAKVKRKLTTQDLFRRFNFRQHKDESSGPEKLSEDDSILPNALVSSDAEAGGPKDTPPSSPPGQKHDDADSIKIANIAESHTERNTGQQGDEDGDELPTLEVLLSSNRNVLPENGELGKGKSRALDGLAPAAEEKKTNVIKPKFIVLPPKPTAFDLDDSDEDLEIVQTEPKSLTVFDNLPGQGGRESDKFLHLRHLANLVSPSKKRPKGPNSLTQTELEFQLREKARKQILKDREERFNDLRARGIVIQTAEEREQEQLAIVNILEKARAEDRALAKKEKDAAKKNGNIGEEGALDESDDEDWAEDVDDEADVDISGSENEDEMEYESADADDEEEEGEEDEDNEAAANPFIGNEAEDDSASDEETTRPDVSKALEYQSDGDADDDPTEETRPIARKPRNRKVVLDEDEDNDEEHQEQLESPGDKAMAAFGFQAPKASDIGLTQIFGGTIADGGTQDGFQAIDVEQDSLAFLRQLPQGTAPEFSTAMLRSPKLVQDSQVIHAQESMTSYASQQINLGLSQFASQFTDMSPSKMSEFPEPTQDIGFVVSRAPVGKRDVPPSTIDTVLMTVEESPMLKKKSRLVRGKKQTAILSEDEDEPSNASEPDDEQEFEPTKDAFDVLFKSANKRTAQVDIFDKKNSEAKNMVEDQAEESQDEYAGLGGASDDESAAGDLDEEMKQMIDEGHVDVDERKLAAFFADKERKEDEKRINKLYKDVTTGLLRRKRGAELGDLSDPDDEAAERRRRKQEEFARMRKALHEDEKIGKLAQNPKQQAFLQSVEDLDDHGMDYLDEPETQPDSVPDSQPAEDGAETGAISIVAPNPLKRNLPEDFTSETKENKPPKSHRRTAVNSVSKRPATLAEIRKSLSFLTDEPLVPDSQLTASEAGSDDEDINGESLTRASTLRSTESFDSVGSKMVVNRLTRTRSEDDASSSRPLAFQAASSSSGSMFKKPNLLRRTTNLSTTSSTSSSSKSASNSTTENAVRMGGSKKSNIHYQAREAERKRIVEVAEKKRNAQVEKRVKSTGRSILGLLRGDASGFE